MTATTGLTGLSSSVAWRVFMQDPQKQLDKFAKNKDVQKDLDYFKKAITKFTSVDDLLKDQRAVKILLSAYDLEDEAKNGMGRIKKVLTEDPTATGALSSRLADSRFAAMAKDLRLDQGLTKLKSVTKQITIATNYVQSEFEQALGDQDPALREAAYFARNTSKTANVYNILGDKIIRDVVQSTLNIPAQLAIQPVETQARVITSKLKIDQFTSAVKNANLSTSQITTAKQDAAVLEGNLKISDAAVKQVTSLQTAINKAVSDYDALAHRTIDPVENATQQDAIPQLLRFEQLLSAGSAAINGAGQNIIKLQQLVTDAGNPANSTKLAAYKSSFAALITTISGQINGASVKTPTTVDINANGGTAPTENILQFDNNAVLTTQLKANGSKPVTINVFNAADLTDALDAAKTAFDALANSNDTANLSAATNKLTSALNRSVAIKTSLANDKAILTDKSDDVLYNAPLNSSDILKGKQSIDDALTRTQNVADLLKQIGTLAESSASRASNADRTDLTTKFTALRTQLYNTINTTGTNGLDNLLTLNGQAQYNVLSLPDGNGGSENINLYANGAGGTIHDIVTALDSAGVGDIASAQALSLQAVQLTNRTDTASKSLNGDQPVFASVVKNYDPKAKIDQVFFDLQKNLDKTITAAAVGKSNLLSSDQNEISFAVSSSTDLLKLHPAKTFKSDVASQLQDIVTQITSGTLTATRSAVQSLSAVVDRTSRYLGSDNRNLTFEQGRIGAILDTLDAETASNGTSKYKVNSFTEKFLTRYLTLNGGTGATFSSSQAASLDLYSGNTASASSLLSLSLSI